MAQENYQLIDKKATNKTKKLYSNLQTVAKSGVMFGHQDDLAYGVGWKEEAGRSDVKDVAGTYPAVFGWDFGKIANGKNIDEVSYKRMRQWMKDVYQMGGVNTISLHIDNYTSGGNSWDTTATVKHILPGGKDHDKYVENLDNMADYIKSLKKGWTKIPLIFRPFHEHNGSWFWWGKGNCSEEDYIALWKFTVDYMVNQRNVHQLIYAYSPDASRLKPDSLREDYLYGYPGDDYTDMLGIDDYWNVGRPENNKSTDDQKKQFVENIEMLNVLAKEKGKIAAITETGLESVTNPKWFTEKILKPIQSSKDLELSYVLVWRNADDKHHYAPYPGHPSVEDFKQFSEDERILFKKDIKNMYK